MHRIRFKCSFVSEMDMPLNARAIARLTVPLTLALRARVGPRVGWLAGSAAEKVQAEKGKKTPFKKFPGTRHFPHDTGFGGPAGTYIGAAGDDCVLSPSLRSFF